MAYKLIWSPAARDDLHDIIVFIVRDNPHRTMSFGYELISETDRLQEFPELGRIVPEYKMTSFAKLSFVRIELCIESITSISSARLHAFDIQHEEFQSCKSGHSEVSSYYDHENQVSNDEGKRTPTGCLGFTIRSLGI